MPPLIDNISVTLTAKPVYCDLCSFDYHWGCINALLWFDIVVRVTEKVVCTRTHHFNGHFPGRIGLAGCAIDFFNKEFWYTV